MTTAQKAVKAAQNRKRWGRNATLRYCLNHSVPLSVYRLARQLEATKCTNI